MHPSGLPADKLLAACDETRTRRSGPGGQHRNKVESAVVLLHVVSGVSAEANERRSQHQNRAKALFRLRINLALEVRESLEESAPASELWHSRCRNGRISVNPGHDDFPVLLAEVLDRIAACECDVREAASQLNCTMSQLVKFLKQEPRAFALVNRQRQDAGLKTLK